MTAVLYNYERGPAVSGEALARGNGRNCKNALTAATNLRCALEFPGESRKSSSCTSTRAFVASFRPRRRRDEKYVFRRRQTSVGTRQAK